MERICFSIFNFGEILSYASFYACVQYVYALTVDPVLICSENNPRMLLDTHHVTSPHLQYWVSVGITYG
jgi:hypothetical protein